MQTFYITRREDDMWPKTSRHYFGDTRERIAAAKLAQKQSWLKKLAGRKF